MWDQNAPKQTLFQHTAKTAAVGIVAGLTLAAPQAEAIPANDVMTEMNNEERFAYISGVVDGLAFARWLNDRPSQTGTQCIYEWYYSGSGNAVITIENMLEAYPERHADVLIHALIREECGEQGE